MLNFQVRSGLTSSPYADVNAVTTDSPGTWVSTDHRCIAWCKQLVLSLNRALYDCVDKTDRQITKSSAYRRDVFSYHLVKRSGGKKYVDEETRHPKQIVFDKDGFWSDGMKRQFSFVREKVSENSHLMIKIMDDPKHKNVFIDASNFEHDNWVYGCKVSNVHKNTRYCERGDNLSHLSGIVPSNGKRKSVHLDMHALQKAHGYTHLLVFVPRGAEHVKVNIDVFNEKDRNFAADTPRWISFWTSYPVVKATAASAVFYNVSLLNMDQAWQAYDIIAEPLDACEDEEHFGLMRFVTPWANDATQTLIQPSGATKLTARLQSMKPKEGYYRNPEMQLYLNPTCRYRISIQSNIPRMWGQMVRFYAPMILPMCVAVLLLCLVQQLKLLQAEGYCPALVTVMKDRVTPISVVMPSRLLAALLGTSVLADLVPANDLAYLADKGVDFGVLPIVVFFVCIGIVLVISAAAWATVLVFGHAANKTVSRFLTARVTAHDLITDVALSGLSRVPFVLSGVLIALAAATCGSAALCFGTFLHFLQLFHGYEDYLKSLLKETAGIEEKKKRDLSSLNFQLTVALLWAFASVLNLPSLMALARNAPFSTRLEPDPSLVVAIVFAAAMGVTWGDRSPKQNVKHYDKLATALQFLCVLIVLFGSVSIYRVNYFLSAAMVCVSLHQILAPKMTVEEIRLAEEERKKVAEKEKDAGENFYEKLPFR